MFIFFFLAHNAVVTQSVFAPVPQLVFDQLEQNSGDPLNQQQQPGIIDFTEFFLKAFLQEYCFNFTNFSF